MVKLEKYPHAQSTFATDSCQYSVKGVAYWVNDLKKEVGRRKMDEGNWKKEGGLKNILLWRGQGEVNRACHFIKLP